LGKHKRPLQGKTVVITRAVEQSRELSEALEALGAEVLLLPMIAFAAPENSGPFDAALARLADFDWVLFTSQNAVRFFFQRGCRLEMERSSQTAAPGPRFAAVGAATAQAARNLDIRIDLVATTESGEGLAAELKGKMAGARVLLPRSDRADQRLPDALRSAGAIVEEVVAYRTVAPESFDSAVVSVVKEGSASVVVFASPSAVDNFLVVIGLDEVKRFAGTTQLAAIGPTTAAAIRGAGLTVGIESEESSGAGMAGAIAAFYEKSSVTARNS
jgi:uroporphyrinogen III methyltransferase / synthase